VTLLTSLLFGLLPAFRLPEPASTLRSGYLGSSQGKRGPGWNLLVGGQVALAVSLVVASVLLLRSIQEILSAETHFRSEEILTVDLDFQASGINSQAERSAKLNELKAELSSLPGVIDVGFVSYLPITQRMWRGSVFLPPMPAEGLPDRLAPGVGWRLVDEDYFRAMGVPLLRGRIFSQEDDLNSPPVIILNEALERALFPDQDAVGSVVQFIPFWRDTDLEVVGVVAEARDWRVPAGEQLEGFIFWPQKPNYTIFLTMVLHTDGNPATLITPVRERLRALVPNVPGTFRTMESLLAESFRDRTFTLGVVGVFALLSLFLSAVGIYGVVSYTVSAQTREIGIMLALGAQMGAVRAQIFLRSARVVVVGILVGIGLAMIVGGVLESFLFEVEPRDPVTMALAPLVLLISASFAILLPVVKHTRVDPVNAMRME